MLNLRRLHYFVTVAEEQHFGRAAKRLHMAQPPLSQQIKRLEQELGLILFDRSKRQVSLTVQGEAFLPEARRLVVQADQLQAKMSNLAQGTDGTLRLGFVDSAAYALMPRLVRTYRRRWPSAGLELSSLTSDQQVEALKAGQIDVGIVRALPSGVDVHQQTIMDEQLMLAVASDNPLSEQSRVDFDDVRNLTNPTFIGFNRTRSPSLFAELQRIFARNDATYDPSIEVTEYSTVLGLVASGQGIAVVPETTQSFQLDELVYLPLGGDDATSSMTMISRQGDSSPLIERLFDLADDYRQNGVTE